MAEIDLRSADQTINKQIPNGLPGEAMRKSMENKNILAEKGSLYVGTGAVERVKILEDDYLIAQTGKLTPGLDNAVLVADSTSSMGLSYKNISDVGSVLYNQPQNLEDAQQKQARANIGAASNVVGDGLNVSDGVISLPVSSNGNLGGIKVSVVQSLPTTLVDDVFYFVTT